MGDKPTLTEFAKTRRTPHAKCVLCQSQRLNRLFMEALEARVQAVALREYYAEHEGVEIKSHETLRAHLSHLELPNRWTEAQNQVLENLPQNVAD